VKGEFFSIASALVFLAASVRAHNHSNGQIFPPHQNSPAQISNNPARSLQQLFAAGNVSSSLKNPVDYGAKSVMRRRI
jgi:hypothetical protein